MWTRGWITLSALIVFGVGGLEAQERSRPGMRDSGPDRGPSPEMIMSMREQLDLSEDQLAALEELRAQAVQLRNGHRAARAELMSRFRAGDIEREELRTSLEAMRAGRPEVAEARRERIESILDEAQLETLDSLRERRRAFRRGQASMMRGGRGPAMRGPGLRGPRGPRVGRRAPARWGRGAVRAGRPDRWRRDAGVRPLRPFGPGWQRRD